jgi:hypothetical protein
MCNQIQISIRRKVLYSIMLFAILFASIGTTAVTAQAAGSATARIQSTQTPEDAQSTTGPIPPQAALDVSSLDYVAGASAVLINGVPAYLWRHGCGPTTAGMMIGYWDSKAGFDWLIPGNASTQTTAVDNAIASQTGAKNNYTDYVLPNDEYSSTVLPDKSELPVGDEHPNNSIADFMKTSQSYVGNFYGWSWFSDFRPALLGYVQLKNPGGYSVSSTSSKYSAASTWKVLKTEINAKRPVGLLVDSNGDGWTDHFIPTFGYDDSTGIRKYAAYNTWDDDLHWYDFGPMQYGKPWGIYGAITLNVVQVKQTISGNAGVAGATLTYTDSTVKTITADASGNYSIKVPYKWSGKVTPTKSGVPAFSPAYRTYTNVITNLTGQYYKANKLATFVSIASQDGYVLESTETSGVGNAVNAASTAFLIGDHATKRQYRSILSFSTGVSLPDTAVITKATIRVLKQNIVGGGDPVTTFQGIWVDVKNGTFGLASLEKSDFQTAANKSFGPFKPVPVSNWYIINLTGVDTYINKLSTASGLTQIRLRFNLDDNNDAVANYLSLYSGDAAVAYRPQLIIQYYLP